MNDGRESTVMRLITLMVITSVLLGCSQATSPPVTANNPGVTPSENQSSTIINKIHPCSLVTKEEVSSALGADVKLASYDAVCSYSVSAEAGSTGEARAGSMVVLVVTADSPQFQKFGSAADEHTHIQPVSDLGDKALLFMSKELPEKGPKAIRVLKGDIYFAIGMRQLGKPVPVDVLKELAVRALSRLP